MINPFSGESAKEVAAVFLETGSDTPHAGMCVDGLATALSVMPWNMACRKLVDIPLIE